MLCSWCVQLHSRLTTNSQEHYARQAVTQYFVPPNSLRRLTTVRVSTRVTITSFSLPSLHFADNLSVEAFRFCYHKNLKKKNWFDTK